MTNLTGKYRKIFSDAEWNQIDNHKFILTDLGKKILKLPWYKKLGMPTVFVDSINENSLHYAGKLKETGISVNDVRQYYKGRTTIDSDSVSEEFVEAFQRGWIDEKNTSEVSLLLSRNLIISKERANRENQYLLNYLQSKENKSNKSPKPMKFKLPKIKQPKTPKQKQSVRNRKVGVYYTAGRMVSRHPIGKRR